jgi:putative two-component system response regulator
MMVDGTIAIVDDEPANIQVVQNHLREAGYHRFVTTEKSAEALDLILREPPDLLILDIVTPTVADHNILQTVKATEATSHVPVLILTSTTDPEVKRKALELGATDFLAKPVDPLDLIPRVRNTLQTKAYHDQLARENARLQQEVRRRTAELAASREGVVNCLARASEYRDDDTGHHVHRVGKYAGIIARELGFDDAHVELLELAAQLHDLGKIAVADAILRKPGKLTDDEFAQMQKHCAYAKKILRPIDEDQTRLLRWYSHHTADVMQIRTSPLLELAARIAQTHHEWWDGTGYPLGLSGEDIPIEGRVTAVADVYDALASARPYKAGFTHEKCFAILEEDRGTHFDPKVIDAFFARIEDIVKLQVQYR